MIDNIKRFIKFKITQIKTKKILKNGIDICIDCGPGDRHGNNGWTTIDMRKNSDLYWDLRNGIPFPDSSVSKIYSSHFLEHLSYRELVIFLSECLRVLKNNGLFYAVVPDAKKYILAYLQSNDIAYVNQVAYCNDKNKDGNHKIMFDDNFLIMVLFQAGFESVGLRSFDSSIDLEKRKNDSIFIQCIKPTTNTERAEQ